MSQAQIAIPPTTPEERARAHRNKSQWYAARAAEFRADACDQALVQDYEACAIAREAAEANEGFAQLYEMRALYETQGYPEGWTQ